MRELVSMFLVLNESSRSESIVVIFVVFRVVCC